MEQKMMLTLWFAAILQPLPTTYPATLLMIGFFGIVSFNIQPLRLRSRDPTALYQH